MGPPKCPRHMGTARPRSRPICKRGTFGGVAGRRLDVLYMCSCTQFPADSPHCFVDTIQRTCYTGNHWIASCGVFVDDVLDQLLSEATTEQPPAHDKWPSGANRGIAAVKYTHDAMIDLIIQNPSISQNALAAHFGYTASWVSQIIASDSFQSKLAERKDKLVDPLIRNSIEEGFRAMVIRSQEILMEKLNGPAHLIPDQLALRTMELATRAAGYGARDGGTQVTQVNMNVHLEDLGNNLTNLLQRKKSEVIDIGDLDE